MLYNEISGNKNIIKDFLIEKGFEEKEISISSPEIFQDNSEQAKFRFNARVKMSV
ncbi:MAG: hypothetical protein QM532_02355 [Cyanobium sp. MAG06]|nr:hypothetical protein [Cyanobium sp. MAG06]